MKRFLIASLSILCTTLIACQITNPLPLNPDVYLDPRLPQADRAELRQVLQALDPSLWADVSYISENQTVYGTSSRAREAGTLLKANTDSQNIFQHQNGTAYWFPSDSRADLATAADLPPEAPCARQDGVGERSGPYYRLCHPVGTASFPTNWMKTRVYLPRAEPQNNPEAGGYFDKARLTQGIQTSDVTIVGGAFIYAGGWGFNGSSKPDPKVRSLDAGFQLSTGLPLLSNPGQPNPLSPARGAWTLFIKVANGGSAFAFTDVLPPRQLSGLYEFTGGQWVDLTFFHFQDLIVVAAVSENGQKKRVLVGRLNRGSGWNADGIGTRYKMMATIGQGRRGLPDPGANPPANYTLAQKLRSTAYLNNVKFANTKIGKVLPSQYIPPVDAPVGSVYSGTEAISIQPANGGLPWTQAIVNEFPNNTLVARDFNINNPDSDIYPDKLQTSPEGEFKSDLFCVSIDLREPTGLSFSLDFPLVRFGWKPTAPNCSIIAAGNRLTAQSAVVAPSVLAGVVVKRTSGQQLARQSVNLTNLGSKFSKMSYTIYPLQQRADRNGLTALTPRRVRNPVSPVNSPRIAPWAANLFQAKTGVLRHPLNPVRNDGAEKLNYEIRANCSEAGGLLNTNFDIVYSTGLIDDNETPLDLSDDQPELKVVTISVKLECNPLAIISVPSSITLTGTVGSSTNTVPLSISNIGDLDSTLEYKRFFVTENILDSSLLNPVPIAGAVARPQAVVVPPSLENSLIQANGFSPSTISTGELKVVTEGTPVSSSIPVSYYCSSAGSFTRYINIVYKTGATDDNGVAILENVAVEVKVTCAARVAVAKANFTRTPFILEAWVPDKGTSILGISNVGDQGSILEWRVVSVSDTRATASGSGSLVAGSSANIPVTFACSVRGSYGFEVSVAYKTAGQQSETIERVQLGASCKQIFYNVCWYGNFTINGGDSVQIILKEKDTFFYQTYTSGFSISVDRGIVTRQGNVTYFDAPAFVQAGAPNSSQEADAKELSVNNFPICTLSRFRHIIPLRHDLIKHNTH
jgi:hypothetical protein